MKAVVLVSGGLDSLVTAAEAIEAGRRCIFVHVGYGQRTAERERRAFEAICEHYNPEKTFVADISYLKDIGGSSLTDDGAEIPDAGPCAGIPTTYVPFRNAHLITIGASLGEVEGAGEIWIGATQIDYSGYPDCRRVFFDAMEQAIEVGTKPDTHMRIYTPLAHLGKGEIVKEGLRLAAPLELSWSCYRETEVACGKCESCVLRLKGFAEAGVKDVIAYRGG